MPPEWSGWPVPAMEHHAGPATPFSCTVLTDEATCKRYNVTTWKESADPSSVTGSPRIATVDIRPKGRGFHLATCVTLPRSIGEVFEFFTDAGNLDLLTPPWLRFRTVTPLPVIMRQGLRLDYHLRLRGIPINWQSEITKWEPPHRFVDEQRKGPYSYWIHEHLFQERDSGTDVVDRVDYAVPGGRLVHRLFVKGDVTSIFQYRRRKLTEIFQVGEGPSA